MPLEGTQSLDLIVMVAIAIAITAALIAREMRRNRRARAVLIGDGYTVELTPPWFLNHVSRAGEDRPAPSGVWSAWYRDGMLGAYVCTHVAVTDKASARAVEILGARLEIVDEPDGRQAVLAVQDVAVNQPTGVLTLDIDASISTASPPPGPRAFLVMLLDLRQQRIERRLCPVERRFAATGAALKNQPSGKD